MKTIKITEDKVIYTNDNDVVYDINNSVKLTVYHYSFDKSANISVNLNSEGASLEYHFSTINYKDNKFRLKVNHNESKTESNVYNYGVNVLDKTLNFEVMGIVPKTSFSCICNQSNEIINLKNGQSKIKPELLIDNYDVSSNHAAYIGKFKDEELFYLQSRGISYKKANEMLITSLLINSGNKEEKIVKEFLDKLKEENYG